MIKGRGKCKYRRGEGPCALCIGEIENINNKRMECPFNYRGFLRKCIMDSSPHLITEEEREYSRNQYGGV